MLLKPNHSIQTPIGSATLIGKHPDGNRVLCMHTGIRDGKRYTYAKWWVWDGEKITEEYIQEN